MGDRLKSKSKSLQIPGTVSIISPLIILGEGTTALAHLDEDSAAYVLFFVELCIVCGDVFRFFRIHQNLRNA